MAPATKRSAATAKKATTAEKKAAAPEKKLKPAQAHAQKKCDCYQADKPVAQRSCTYRPFPDGWSFVSDAGKGQVRGEIFTPRFIVDRMMVKGGLFPESAVYGERHGDYSEEDMEQFISQRIIEPALGTGNYTTSVLWQKLSFAQAYVERYMGKATELERKRRYLELLYTALASCYAFDIDPGNLEVSTQRILGRSPHALNSPQIQEKWEGIITTSLIESPDAPEDRGEIIRAMVSASLGDAQEHWSAMIQEDGVVQKQYRMAMGEEIPQDVLDTCALILGENLKLFNGIMEKDSYGESSAIPGWGNVIWRWWRIGVMEDLFPITLWESVPMQEMINGSKRRELETRMAAFKEKNYVLSQDGLFAAEEWGSPAAEREYRAMERELKKLS